MLGRQGAFGGTRKPFRLAYAAVVLSAVAFVSAVWVLAHPQAPVPRAQAKPRSHPSAPRPLVPTPIPASRWGHAASGANGMLVTLGPAADRRRRYQLGLSRIRFDAAAMAVSSDHGLTFHRLEGQPMGRCGYHWQGWGVNAIVATRDCVPVWAVDAGGAHARQWMRIENLVPFARVVMVRYTPRGSGM